MNKLLKSILAASLFIFAVASPVMAIATPQTAAAAPGCEGRVLGIPPWYRGITNENPPTCDLKTPDDVGGISSFIWLIVLNIIEMAVVIVAYIAVFFLLYGGFQYIIGGANPSQLESAKKTITNAVVGLIIAMAAIAINNLVFGIIT